MFHRPCKALSLIRPLKSNLSCQITYKSCRESHSHPFQHAREMKNSVLKNILKQNSGVDPHVKNLLQGVIEGRRAALAESITLVESSNEKKKLKAKELIFLVLQFMKNKNLIKNNLSFRIGLSGPPGAGKSTFIESFGNLLTSTDLKVAVLAVDPSSATTGGSILGDKTRMPELSKNKNAFIRPSPSRGYLGGVTRSTNEAILLCEVSGYDIIIVETIGVGQSEYSVSDMVDLFALLIPPGSGDELQGIKRGIMELSDIVIVNKSDGDLVNAAMRVQYEYISALKYMPQKCLHWKPVVKRVSSVTGEGIKELWELMINFKGKMIAKGEFKRKREHQQKAWMWTHLQDNVTNTFLKIPSVRNAIKVYESQVMEEIITPGQAADQILFKIIEEISKVKNI